MDGNKNQLSFLLDVVLGTASENTLLHCLSVHDTYLDVGDTAVYSRVDRARGELMRVRVYRRQHEHRPRVSLSWKPSYLSCHQVGTNLLNRLEGVGGG